MVLFWPIQQELDCISASGCILGKIKFDGLKDIHIFCPTNESISLSSIEKSCIAERLSGLDSGIYSIPMQDDD
jgi:mevalonate pyrophosphate decarboxylase